MSTRSVLLSFFMSAVAVASGFPPLQSSPNLQTPTLLSQSANTVGAVTGYCVRVAYVIPANRSAQSNAVPCLQAALIQYQNWYRDQMDRNGFGPKTFRFETESDGVTPKIYTITVAETDDYLRTDLWGLTLPATTAAGVPLWTPKQIWWVIPEAHLELPNGDIIGGISLGSGNGTGDSSGVAMVGSDTLARMQPQFFTNDLAYQDQIIAELGPYPLQQNVSFPSFAGATFSTISSGALGSGLHEISHAFGQSHDFRNDRNFNGNLMGNGFRGWRGVQYPDRYPSDYARASYASALSLSVSRYFNPDQSYTDNTKPSLTITSSGTNAPTDGLFRIAFSASDPSGLHCALLALDGEIIDEMKLSGTNVTASFATPYYEPGQTNRYTISIFDTQGNKQKTDVNLVPRTGLNRAPKPFVNLSPSTVLVGQEVVLDASQSADPDHTSASLQVEWDLDGDGHFDTAPTTTKLLTNVYSTVGSRLIYARLTDPAGAQSISAPIALQVMSPSLAIQSSSNQVLVSWSARATGFALRTKTALDQPTWSVFDSPGTESNGLKTVILTNTFSNLFLRLER